MTSDVKRWVCPECGISEDSDEMYVPEKTFEGFRHTCSHCFQNYAEEVEMEAVLDD